MCNIVWLVESLHIRSSLRVHVKACISSVDSMAVLFGINMRVRFLKKRRDEVNTTYYCYDILDM